MAVMHDAIKVGREFMGASIGIEFRLCTSRSMFHRRRTITGMINSPTPAPVFGLYEQRSAAAGGQATTQAVLSFGAMAARLHFCYRSLVASGNVKQLRRWASVSKSADA